MSQNPSFEIPTDFYEDKQTDISKKQSASAATGDSNPRFEEDLNKYPCLGPKQKYPLFDGKAPQQNKETINPLLKPQISDRIFSDLPAELIHIILGYYTHSFKDLIKFSTINKTCQQVSDYSLLWLQVKLMFYPPKEYLRCRGYANFFFRLAFESYEAFVERLIRVYYLPILEKQLFSVEAIFPPVYKVQVVPFQQDVAQYKLYTEESHHEMACRISKWWKDLFIEYQRLYHQYVKYGPYLNYLSARARIFIDVNPNFDYIPIRGTVFVGIVSIYLLFNCNKTNFSVENRIGLYLLLGLLGFYMMLFLIYMLSSLVAGVAYDYNNQTLIFRFEHYYLHGFDLPLLALMGIFVSLLLALLKCDGSLGNNFNWWETVLPLWIGFSLVYGLWCYDHRKNPNLWCLSVSKIPVAYVMLSPPVTCTLIACYYDNIYTGPFQYTLLPLYPIFLLAIIAFGHRLYTICIVVFDLILGRRIVRVFTNKVWLTYLSYFIVLNMTNICTMINCWSVIMLLIDSYRIDDNDWDKRFFTVHFTPLTCFLLFLFSCPYTLLGPFVENRYYELRV